MSDVQVRMKNNESAEIICSFTPDISLPDSSTQQLFLTSNDNNVISLVNAINPGQAVTIATLPHQIASNVIPSQVVSNMITLPENESSNQISLQLNESVNIQPDNNKLILQTTNGEDSSSQASHINVTENNLENQSKANTADNSGITTSVVHLDDISNMVLATIQQVTSPVQSVVQQLPTENKGKYFCLSSTEAVEETIRKHTEETFSHFVVAKKTKAYGSPVTSIDISNKFRIHWQSRDLTTTEECAVQIPFEGVPFIYIGEKAYMCHLGRSKSMKNKTSLSLQEEERSEKPKRHRSRMTKKQGCPAKIFVKQIAKFPMFRIPNNSEYLRTQMSQKLRKVLMTSDGNLEHVIQFVGTLPDISEHSNHDIGENTPVREPVDPLIRDKIVELSWEHGENVLPRHIKEVLDDYVVNILFKGKTPPSKNRRRFYPSEKDIANYIYKSKMLSKLTCNEQEQLHCLVKKLQDEHPEEKLSFRIETENRIQSPVIVDEAGNDLSHQQISVPEQKIIFSYQTHEQQRLLKRYGRQTILTEMSKNATNLPFPFFGVFVPTCVDYQLIYLFVVQSRTTQTIKDGLASLVEWNPYWSPKFFVVDYSTDQISSIESIFPACTVLISELSRKQCWKNWLNDPVNSSNLVGDKNDLLKRLTSIANSHTEDTLNKAAQELENSDVWRLSDGLRDWFSVEWLAEAKRWVVGYRHDEFLSTLHFQVTLNDEVNVLRDSHYQYLKNKKLCDFMKYLVESVVPKCYERYVDRIICDYRKQYFLTKTPNTDVPSYLQNKPANVVTHLLEQINKAGKIDYTVSQMQPGIFWIQDKAEPDTTYAMSFGDTTSLPSCVCIDWLKYKLPCKHMVTIFNNCRGWSWDMLCTMYTGNPMLNIDVSSFDKAKEDIILANLKDDGTDIVASCDDTMSGNNKQYITIIKSSDSAVPPVAVPLASALKTTMNSVNASVINASASLTGRMVNTNDTDKVNPESFHFLTNLATDCDTFCQELSNTIHQVDNRNMLQKVKLDLQLMLNDVKLEIAKIPSTTRSAKRLQDTTNSFHNLKKMKPNFNITELRQSVTGLNDNFTPSEKQSSTNTLVLTNVEQKNKDGSFSVMDGVSDTVEDGEVWIFDAELDIKLHKIDQKHILNGEHLSISVMRSVQNILRHQFEDVSGLCDPEQLALLSDDIQRFEGKGKVLQLHIADNDHCSASSRIAENIYIFCCTLSSKAKVIEQILKMTAENCMGDNILFIERMEKGDEVASCGLYAIAYTVAIAFDIEPRNLVFDENEMRSHLAECLEDMCFSMFPLKTT